MDGHGSWRDIVFVERLWRSVKNEDVYLRAYDNAAEARSWIGSYLAFCNRKRPHSSLDGRRSDQANFPQLGGGGGCMKVTAVVGYRSGRTMPSLCDAPQRQPIEMTGRKAIHCNRNAVRCSDLRAVVVDSFYR
jgi:hypothetical protein